MARKARGAEADAVYSVLGIKVEVDGYDAQADASISYDIRQPQYSQHLDADEPVFKFVTRLTIFTECSGIQETDSLVWVPLGLQETKASH